MGAFLQGLDLQMLKKAGIVTITKKKFSIPIRGVGVTKQALSFIYIIPSTYTGEKFGLLTHLTKVKNYGKD